jgi:MOSC domain-containing protein YiiM
VTILRVWSVNVARPRVIGQRHGADVWSAIGKVPVTSDSVELGWLNLSGDDQSDRSVHGGIDKGVYVYPGEHQPLWRSAGIAAAPGLFGENLTTEGLTEEDVHLGDHFTWGPCELVVTQPRTPCYKLAMHLRRPDIAKLMIDSGSSGWYLRVLRTGTVTIGEPMRRTVHRADLPTIHDVFAWTIRAPREPANIRRLLAVAELASQYAQGLANLGR